MAKADVEFTFCSGYGRLPVFFLVCWKRKKTLGLMKKKKERGNINNVCFNKKKILNNKNTDDFIVQEVKEKIMRKNSLFFPLYILSVKLSENV